MIGPRGSRDWFDRPDVVVFWVLVALALALGFVVSAWVLR